jgi:hypothetical protein
VAEHASLEGFDRGEGAGGQISAGPLGGVHDRGSEAGTGREVGAGDHDAGGLTQGVAPGQAEQLRLSDENGDGEQSGVAEDADYDAGPIVAHVDPSAASISLRDRAQPKGDPLLSNRQSRWRTQGRRASAAARAARCCTRRHRPAHRGAAGLSREVTSVARRSQTLRDVPAAAYVITRDQIDRRF